MRWAALALAAFAGLALAARLQGPWAAHLGTFFGLYAVAWVAVWRASRQRLDLRTVWLGALVFRALCVPLVPSLSDDVYRYVWEGRIQNAGFDPYRFAPDAPELAARRDDVWARVNHRDLAAIYPPLAQLVFRGLALLGGVTAFKLAFVVFDLAGIAIAGIVLRRRHLPIERLILYAWNPLVVVEVAAGGHLEPLALLPLVGAIALLPRQRTWGWASLAASIATRYAALVTVPAFGRAARPGWRGVLAALAVAIGSFALYAGAGLHRFDSLRVYAEHWRYNASLFALLERALPADPIGVRRVAMALTALASFGVAFWNVAAARRALAALAIALVLSPTVHPWYLCWPLVLVPFVPEWPGNAVFAWSATMPLAYLYLYPAAGIGPLQAPGWGLQLLEMAPVLACVAWPGIRRRRAPRHPSIRAFEPDRHLSGEPL